MSRRDYSSKTHKYQTPRKLVRRDKLKGEIIKKRLQFLAIVFTVCSLLVFFGYWLFFSPIFHLTDIVIQEKNVPIVHPQLLKKVNEILDGRIFFILPQSSYFLFSAKDAVKTLNDFTGYQPSIENIMAQVKFPNKLTIEFQQKIPLLKIVVKPIEAVDEAQPSKFDSFDAEALQKPPFEPYYLVDLHGVIVADDINEKAAVLPVAHLFAKTPHTFALGKPILSQDAVSSTVVLYDFFKFNSSLLPNIDYVEFSNDNLMEGAVHTSAGFIVYVSFKHSLQEELNRLLLTLENVKNQKDKLSYIDLRIENRAYVCCNLGIEGSN